MSLNFLVEHDRHGKIPTRITVYGEIEDAEERLCRLEDEQTDELNACLETGKSVRMEYIILGADSVDTIKHTHGRYFGGEYEVVVSTEIHYVAGWGEKTRWTREEKISAESWAFAGALSSK